jgi:glutaminyl-peptide cyclotransferase
MSAAPRPARRRALAGAVAFVLVLVAAVVFFPRPEANGRLPDLEPGAPLLSVEQVRAYPHDPDAFTQGLEYHAGYLYESTGRYGESSLRQVELETGRVVRRVDLPPQYFGEGLTVLDGRIYQLTWREGIGFVYDLDTFEQVGTFEYTGDGWGLMNDGTSLIMSDGSDRLRFLDPQTFRVTRVLQVRDGAVPVHELNELELVRGEIWANVFHSDHVARIDPRTGRVIAWLDLSGLYPPRQRTDREAVLNGIAYDSATDRLFVTGKLWPRVFEIRVPGLIGEDAPEAGGETGAGDGA